jgi:hypothetical protein
MDEYEELQELERRRAKHILIINNIEAALSDKGKLEGYVAESGERLGMKRYQEWRRAAKERRNAETYELQIVKGTIELLRRSRPEVELLSELFFAIHPYEELGEHQRKIWHLLANKHGIYLKKEERP